MNQASQPATRRRFRSFIPAYRTAFRDDITIETKAVDEAEMRHIVKCAFGRLAAEQAAITEAIQIDTLTRQS